jgi:hypothetical protein
MIAVGVVGLIASVTLTGLAASYQGFDYKCLVEGPFRESPPFVLISEAAEVRGYFSIWPLGRACEWERADGLGFITAGPSWVPTLIALAFLALAGIGRTALTIDARRRVRAAAEESS